MARPPVVAIDKCRCGLPRFVEEEAAGKIDGTLIA
jgi:hypothetical protein